jgi:phage tail sheath gpL-like
MTVVSNPVVNITKAPASQTISNAPQKVLIIGQQTGTFYTSGQLIEEIGNANVEIGNIGKGSHLAEMVRAFKKVNQVTRVDAIPLDDAGGAVDATGTIAFTGTATEAGTITVYIGSRKNHAYSIAVASADTASDIGDKLVTAIGDDEYAVVSGVNTTGSVALTAKNGGTVGNNIGLQVSGAVTGISSTVTAMSGGATDPTLTTLFDVIGEERYQTIIYPGSYAIATLTTDFLDGRWNVSNSIQDGVGIISKTDTFANIGTFLDAQNSQSLVVHCNETVNDALYKGSSLFELDDVISAQFGAIRSLRLTDGSNVSRHVIASNLDLIGGTSAASLPYFNTPLFDLPIIDIGKGFSSTEVASINAKGGFVAGNNVTRSNVILGQVYTTYKTDVAGNVDQTYQFLNYVDTLSNIAEFFFNNLRADYAQYRLTDGAVVNGRNIANEQTLKSSFVEYYNTLSGPDYVLTRAGQENLNYFIENLSFTLDLLDGKVTSIAEVPLVVQLRQMDVILKAVFNT